MASMQSRLFWFLVLDLTFEISSVWSKSLRTKPHIIVIVADDLGYNDVSFHGSDQIPTPNIDKLAYSGIILNNYYVSPICTPTRGALMSGRHPIHTGLQHGVIVGAQPYGLPLNFTIMPEWLKKRGYRTHMVGKWHLGFYKSEYTPMRRGFDSHYGYYQGSCDYYDHTAEYNPLYYKKHHKSKPKDNEEFGYDFRNNTKLDYTAMGQYSTTLFTKKAVDIIQNHNPNDPLFLYLPYQAVHSGNILSGKPLQAPMSYVNRHLDIENSQRRLYAGIMSALDDGVREVVDALKTRGLYDNSVVLFTTDNGGPPNGMDGNAASNFPLRGTKSTLWEGGVRGVGFIHSPIFQKSGYVSEHLLHVCDWLPTFYSAAGGDPKDLHDTDGYDAWDMLSTNGKQVRTELLHNVSPDGKKGAIRVGDYKLLNGLINIIWDGWYPPYQVEEDSHRLHFENPKAKNAIFNKTIEVSYRQNQVLRSSVRQHSSVMVECGPKPENASTNCNPHVKPCLYHIRSDPCEYNNIAEGNENIVKELMDRLQYYVSTSIPEGNKPEDPRGNPRFNKGAWVPWQDQLS